LFIELVGCAFVITGVGCGKSSPSADVDAHGGGGDGSIDSSLESGLSGTSDSGADVAEDAEEQPSQDGGTFDGDACAGGCPSEYVCGFLQSAGCSAIGTCVLVGAICDISTGYFCACDGRSIVTVCGNNGLPQGYQTASYAHAGACEVDSGVGD
jgi:hypothetical protein